ncbi:glycosyltransferase family 2 protein [Brochothrix campestris]|uniref:Glycosyl transferase family protein n=1 Tax=Brochothrix campestris FSL F6-1037 TaxID=1265861 RepID=W7D9H0_9LIST|nr:glycosyltransferase family 2 protein [Brochothrix campestris]EUJ41893.1 glycosyl transferase family protein [Brochothrix campestris FSL F6-1037]
MKKITIVIPAYNEEEVIGVLYEALIAMSQKLPLYAFEYLFVDDGSADGTLMHLNHYRQKDQRVQILALSRNYGKETAMIAGLDYATGDAVVILDADLQDPPALIEEMVYWWEQGYDDVYAKRRSRKGESWLKKITSQRYYAMLQKTTRIPLQRDTGDFRLLDRRCVDALKQMRETQRYTKGLFSWIGYKKKELLFDRQPRAAGKTKWNYLNLINLAIEGFTSFTTVPLRISTVAGFIVSIIAFIYMIVILIKTLLFGSDVSGYPSLMIMILFLGGIQLISLGVIGEYLGRIFNESKNRPLYFIDQFNDKKIDPQQKKN